MSPNFETTLTDPPSYPGRPLNPNAVYHPPLRNHRPNHITRLEGKTQIDARPQDVRCRGIAKHNWHRRRGLRRANAMRCLYLTPSSKFSHILLATQALTRRDTLRRGVFAASRMSSR